MSTVKLQEVKDWCRVIGNRNDALLQRLIDQAEDEALQFLNRTSPPTLPLTYPSCCDSDAVSSENPTSSSENPADVAPGYKKAVCILVQASFEVPDPDEQASMRKNAEVVLFPYRACIGV